MSNANDSVDLSELSAALRHGKMFIVAGGVIGVLIALLFLVVLRPSYRSRATVLLQNFSGASAALSGVAGDQGGGALGGLTSLISLNSGMETELAILESRALMGEVVDSLGLQAEVLDPHGTGPDSLFSNATYQQDLDEGSYSFERVGETYRVSGPGVSMTATPGVPLRVGGATITLRTQGLPDKFKVVFQDYSDAVSAALDVLDVEKLAGSVAEIQYRAHDAATAAEVPNMLIRRYLARRKTVDRGVNQRRFEFLETHTDSLSTELTQAEDALRRHQEQSGVLAPEENSTSEVEHEMVLRDRLQELKVQSGALAQVIADAAQGSDRVREIAAYPALLENPAINTSLSRLSELEAQRSELLERRTPDDPDVLLLDSEIERVGGQIVTFARSFLDGTRQQEAELTAELGQSQQILAALPAEVQQSYRLERNVKRLSETLLALQTQMVQVKLAAIAEGGDVRKIDTAQPPKRPTFPRPALLLALGLIGGMALGAVGAIGRSLWSPRLRHAPQLARMADVPVIPFDDRAPLLIGHPADASSVLVVPVGTGADAGTVAQRLASMAALREDGVVLADFQHQGKLPLLAGSSDEANGAATGQRWPAEGDAAGYRVYRADAGALAGISRAVEELEGHSALVVIALPTLQHPATAALLSPSRPVVLVARAGKLTRAELQAATAALPRLGVPLLGIVLQNGNHAA